MRRDQDPLSIDDPQNRSKQVKPCFQKDLSDLASIIHRLSQPLTALRGSLELALLTEGSAADYELAVKESLAEADNLVRLLGSLRELVEAEEARAAARRTPLDQLVKEATQDMQVLAESRGSNLELESTERFTVHGNPKWLRQALYKMLHQAIQRSPQGGAVLISLARANHYACLTVSDQGPAVPAPDLEHLSQIFSVGKLFAEAAKRGTLEWATAKRIFEAQGGSTCVQNRLGGGCSFAVRLPLASVS